MTQFATWLNTVTLPEFSDLVRKQFVLHNEKVQPMAEKLFIKRDYSSLQQDSKRIDEVDISTFAKRMREGEDAAKARSGVGYSKTMQSKRVGMEINISEKMRRFGNDHKVKKKLTNLNDLVKHRAELDLCHRFTFADSTSYTDMDGETVDTTTGDGLSLVNNAHTLAHSSTTYSNQVSGNPLFSQGALEAAENLFINEIYNNFGEIRRIDPTHIVTTRDRNTVRKVKQLLKSQADPSSSNSGVVNTFENDYDHIALPYIDTTATGARDTTKSKYWFLVAQGTWNGYYGVWDQPMLKTPDDSGGKDFHNDDWFYGTRGRYGIVTVSGKGLVGSLPTS